MRRPSSILGLVALFAVLLVLHYMVRPLVATRATVDFLAIAVLLISVRVRAGIATAVGLGAGLIADSLAPSAFGAAMLAMALVAFAASWLKGTFFAEHLALNAAFLFIGKLAFDLVFLIAEGRLSGSRLLVQLALWSTLSALITAAIGLLVLVVFRPMVDGPRGRA
jgi:rod shape-determining protein MreD